MKLKKGIPSVVIKHGQGRMASQKSSARGHLQVSVTPVPNKVTITKQMMPKISNPIPSYRPPTV